MFQNKAKLNSSIVDALDKNVLELEKRECNQAAVITEVKPWRKPSCSLERQHWQILHGGQKIT